MKYKMVFKCPRFNKWYEIIHHKDSARARNCSGRVYWENDYLDIVQPTLKELLGLLKKLNIKWASCDKLYWDAYHTSFYEAERANVLMGADNEAFYKIMPVPKMKEFRAYYVDSKDYIDGLAIGHYTRKRDAKNACQNHFDKLRRTNNE